MKCRPLFGIQSGSSGLEAVIIATTPMGVTWFLIFILFYLYILHLFSCLMQLFRRYCQISSMTGDRTRVFKTRVSRHRKQDQGGCMSPNLHILFQVSCPSSDAIARYHPRLSIHPWSPRLVSGVITTRPPRLYDLHPLSILTFSIFFQVLCPCSGIIVRYHPRLSIEPDTSELETGVIITRLPRLQASSQHFS